MVVGHEAFHRADLDAKIADTTFEPVDDPFLVFPADFDCIRGAPLAAQATEYAFPDIVLYLSASDRTVNPLLLGIHERSGTLEQVPDYRFRHDEYSHLFRPLPFCTTDAWIQGEDNVRHIRDL